MILLSLWMSFLNKQNYKNNKYMEKARIKFNGGNLALLFGQPFES